MSARLKEDVVDIRKKKRIRNIGIIIIVIIAILSLIEASKDSPFWYLVEGGSLPKEKVSEQYFENKEDIQKIVKFVVQYEQEDDASIKFQEVEKFGPNDIIVRQWTPSGPLRDIKSQIEKPDLELIQKLFRESKFYEIYHDKRSNSVVFDASAYRVSKWSGIVVTLDGQVTDGLLGGSEILEQEKIEDNVYFIKCS